MVDRRLILEIFHDFCGNFQFFLQRNSVKPLGICYAVLLYYVLLTPTPRRPHAPAGLFLVNLDHLHEHRTGTVTVGADGWRHSETHSDRPRDDNYDRQTAPTP